MLHFIALAGQVGGLMPGGLACVLRKMHDLKRRLPSVGGGYLAQLRYPPPLRPRRRHHLPAALLSDGAY